MGKPSLAVVIACAAVGALVLIFLLVRVSLCIRRRNSNPVPLPPPRPLTAFSTLPWNANHSTTNLSSSKLDLSSPISLSPTSYQSELLLAQQKHSGGRSRNVYRQYSGSTLNTDEVPLHQPPSPITRASSPMTDALLIPPQPSYIGTTTPGTSSNRSSAQLSLHSLTEESDIASYPPQRHQSATYFPPFDPLTEDSPSSESPTGSPYPNGAPPRPSGVSSRRQSLTGSVSTAQTGRSARSTRTHSTIRGPPHKPHNRIEIVLPAPLAPQNQLDSSYLQQLHERDMTYGMNSRQSVVDPWLRVGRENMGPSNSTRQPSREGGVRHRTVSSESRAQPRSRQSRLPSSSSLSSLTARTPNQSVGSSRSSFSSAHSHTGRISLQNEGGLDTSDLPPVPRVPSIYANGSGSSTSPSPSPSTPVLTLSESITGLGQMSNSNKANSTPRSPSTPVLALSGSITGTGNLSGLGGDSTSKNAVRPSNSETRQPPEPDTVDDKAHLPP